jgi:hypothetical protein
LRIATALLSTTLMGASSRVATRTSTSCSALPLATTGAAGRESVVTSTAAHTAAMRPKITRQTTATFMAPLLLVDDDVAVCVFQSLLSFP